MIYSTAKIRQVFGTTKLLEQKVYCPSEQRPCRHGSIRFPRQDDDRKPVRGRTLQTLPTTHKIKNRGFIWKLRIIFLSLQRQLGEFAERMTTFMTIMVVSSPTFTSHHSTLGRWLCLYRNLRNRDTVLNQILIRALKSYCQFDVLVLHNKQLFKLFLISSVSLGW